MWFSLSRHRDFEQTFKEGIVRKSSHLKFYYLPNESGLKLGIPVKKNSAARFFGTVFAEKSANLPVFLLREDF